MQIQAHQEKQVVDHVTRPNPSLANLLSSHSTNTSLPGIKVRVRRKAKMAQIKLTYFNLRARAEPARLVLAYAGAKYDDVRLPAPWDNPKPWATLKPTTPYGQCPLLEWDGEVIAQSMAITR